MKKEKFVRIVSEQKGGKENLMMKTVGKIMKENGSFLAKRLG